MKTCNQCGIDKDDSCYSKSLRKSGNRILSHICKQCTKERDANAYANESDEDREARKQRVKEWRANNKEAIRQLKRKYRLEKKTLKLNTLINDAHVIARDKYLAKIKAKELKNSTALHDAHVRLFFSDVARLARWKNKFDINYIVNQRMRVAIRKALKGNKAGRAWESLVGYSVEDLRVHLEKTLPKGMCIEDMFNGNLHIDHIIPKSLFDMSDESQVKAAWCISNLRLIPAKDNLSKGDKIEYLL